MPISPVEQSACHQGFVEQILGSFAISIKNTAIFLCFFNKRMKYMINFAPIVGRPAPDLGQVARELGQKLGPAVYQSCVYLSHPCFSAARAIACAATGAVSRRKIQIKVPFTNTS